MGHRVLLLCVALNAVPLRGALADELRVVRYRKPSGEVGFTQTLERVPEGAVVLDAPLPSSGEVMTHSEWEARRALEPEPEKKPEPKPTRLEPRPYEAQRMSFDELRSQTNPTQHSGGAARAQPREPTDDSVIEAYRREYDDARRDLDRIREEKDPYPEHGRYCRNEHFETVCDTAEEREQQRRKREEAMKSRVEAIEDDCMRNGACQPVDLMDRPY